MATCMARLAVAIVAMAHGVEPSLSVTETAASLASFGYGDAPGIEPLEMYRDVHRCMNMTRWCMVRRIATERGSLGVAASGALDCDCFSYPGARFGV